MQPMPDDGFDYRVPPVLKLLTLYLEKHEDLCAEERQVIIATVKQVGTVLIALPASGWYEFSSDLRP